jgi:hypothetical protein
VSAFSPWPIIGFGTTLLFALRFSAMGVLPQYPAKRVRKSLEAREPPQRPTPPDDPADFEPPGEDARYSWRIPSDHTSEEDRAPPERVGITRERRYRHTWGGEWMPAVVTLCVLLSALYIIVKGDVYPDTQQKWAAGVVGTIVGYWLKK